MSISVLESLNKSLDNAMESDPSIFLIGEDILDPYGGAFKVTRGLSTKYPERVIGTPISEAGIVGLAIGMGLCGLHPVVEIMFGDFITLITDQIINHAAKFRWMYNSTVHVPMVVRAPMGGRRGYGPTHSQSLEKHFLGVPGLSVIAPCSIGNPGKLLATAVASDDPILFIEHKLLYPLAVLEDDNEVLKDFKIQAGNDQYPSYVIQSQYPAQITMAVYGYNFELARLAAHELMMEYEIFSDIVVFTKLSPFNLETLYPSLSRTGRLLTIEEGTISLGWGAEIMAQVSERNFPVRMKRIAARDLPIANAKSLEEAILPSVNQIVRSTLALVTQ